LSAAQACGPGNSPKSLGPRRAPLPSARPLHYERLRNHGFSATDAVRAYCHSGFRSIAMVISVLLQRSEGGALGMGGGGSGLGGLFSPPRRRRHADAHDSHSRGPVLRNQSQSDIAGAARTASVFSRRQPGHAVPDVARSQEFAAAEHAEASRRSFAARLGIQLMRFAVAFAPRAKFSARRRLLCLRFARSVPYAAIPWRG